MQKRTPVNTMALLLAAVLGAGFTLAPSAAGPAHASDRYAWCAVYSERTVGATNCGFTTLAQCRATISGIGGTCQPNPTYAPDASPAPKPRKPRY